MPCLRNTNYYLACGLAALLLLVTAAVSADFSVAEITPKIDKQALQLNGNLELILSAKVDEALTKGIPLDVTIGIKLYSERGWYIWDENIANWEIRRRIRYHALSRQYLVNANSEQPEEVESFIELSQALKYMGTLNDLKLNFTSPVATGRRYVVKIRAQLDIESLPAPLRPVAYASLDWHLNSGWSKWKVQP